jgi:hypothetical protein
MGWARSSRWNPLTSVDTYRPLLLILIVDAPRELATVITIFAVLAMYPRVT